ncbi:MAG: hypothetical protein PHQ43_08190 [Dehalococcoidales bacterium]|jgi:hypothetical protein|nr:hypothetical protein [Dehalococcoidales bacterium]
MHLDDAAKSLDAIRKMASVGDKSYATDEVIKELVYLCESLILELYRHERMIERIDER